MCLVHPIATSDLISPLANPRFTTFLALTIKEKFQIQQRSISGSEIKHDPCKLACRQFSKTQHLQRICLWTRLRSTCRVWWKSLICCWLPQPCTWGWSYSEATTMPGLPFPRPSFPQPSSLPKARSCRSHLLLLLLLENCSSAISASSR